MILLTKIELVNDYTRVDKRPGQVRSEELIGIDAWSVVTAEKLLYNGGQEGCTVFIAEGRGYIHVRELMTDVIHQVEAEIQDAD